MTACARAALALTLLCAAPPLALADRWESTRADVIDPLNSELHRHLPTYLRDRDLGAILDLYETSVGDGALDLLLRNYLQPAVLLRNRGAAGNWLALRLVGTESNRDAVGARVRVKTGERWQVREGSAGSGFLSSHSRIQHFGLGEHERADEVVVDWPSGASTRLDGLAAGARYRLVEGEARARLDDVNDDRRGRDARVAARGSARVPPERDSASAP